jgi:hypothetical protein
LSSTNKVEPIVTVEQIHAALAESHPALADALESMTVAIDTVDTIFIRGQELSVLPVDLVDAENPLMKWG